MLDSPTTPRDRTAHAGRRYPPVLDALPDAVITEQDGRIQHVNPEGVRIVRASSAEDLHEHSLAAYLLGGGRAQWLEAVAKLVPGACTETIPVRLRRFDGTIVRAELMSSAVEGYGCNLVETVVRDRSLGARTRSAFTSLARNYRDFFNGIPEAVLVSDRETCEILAVNQMAECLYGYSSQELCGRTLEDLRAGGECDTDAAPGGSTTAVRQCVHRRKDGSTFELEARSHHIPYHGREARLTVIEDVSGRRRRERQQQAQLEVAEALLGSDSLGDGIPQVLATLCQRLDWHLASWWEPAREANKLICRATAHAMQDRPEALLGLYDRSQVEIGEGIVGGAWHRTHPLWSRGTGPTVLSSPNAEFGATARMRDNLAVPVVLGDRAVAVLLVQRTDLHPAPDASASALEVLCCQLAAAWQRQRATEALRAADRRYLGLFESITDAVVVTDAERRITDTNDAFAKLFGYEAREMRGKTPRVLYEDDEAYESGGAVLTRLEAEASVAQHPRLRRKDGSIFPASVSVYTHRDDRGQPLGYVSIVRDATEQQKLEDQVRRAGRMEALGRMAGGMAHDFNNLLVVILGYMEELTEELARDEPDRHAMLEMVRHVTEAGRDSQELTQQLLALGRRQILRPEHLDPNEVVRQTVSGLERAIGENILVDADLAADAWQVHVDAGQLQQVLLNLCGNAGDSMPQGGQLTVRTRNVVLGKEEASQIEGGSPGRWLLLSVEDCGAGISRADLPHIFEPFFTTKGEEGMGLGLSTSYGIVAQSGGFMTVHSESGEGARFDVYLPRSKDAPPQDVQPKEEEAADDPDRAELILVVEDQEQVRTLVMRGLERHGYAVLGAECPDEALAMLEADAAMIDLMVTDIIMPGMNGAELVRRVRRDRPDLPVIYMSGYPGSVIEDCCLDIDRDPILCKPFSHQELAAHVRELLQATKSANAGEAKEEARPDAA